MIIHILIVGFIRMSPFEFTRLNHTHIKRCCEGLQEN